MSSNDTASELMAARVGTLLGGKYQLNRLLGVGGMGAVFDAENTWTGRRVAIKLMLGEMTRHGDLVARFMREARAATKVAHPNIVQVLDLGQDPIDGALYIVQEFLSGKDLGRQIEARGALPPREALEIITQVMSALVAAHAQGVVHRDIKPDNIFLTQLPGGRWSAKLIDFGIAKINETGSGGLGLTRTGAAMGTPIYMSPEQARGEKSIDAQTDIWAIAVVLYEMLWGHSPWTSDNYNALMVEIITSEILRLDTRAPAVSKALADVVHRGLERDRAGRFATMAAFLEALLASGDYAGEPWHPSLAVTRTTETVADEASDVHFAATSATEASGAANATPEPVVSRALTNSTLSESAREIDVVRRGSRSPVPYVAGFVALIAVGAGGVFAMRSFSDHGSVADAHLSTTRSTTAAAPIAPAPPPVTAVQPASDTPPTFVASVTAHPSSAVISIDGEPTRANSIARSFPRDGRSHVLEVSAPGYDTVRSEFTDVSPPAVIDLAPTPPGHHAIHVTTHATSPLLPSPAVTQSSPPASPPQPPSHAPRTGSNQAPILGE